MWSNFFFKKIDIRKKEKTEENKIKAENSIIAEFDKKKSIFYFKETRISKKNEKKI
jgi:hypothetical protein